jgi:hypothetical protein
MIKHSGLFSLTVKDEEEKVFKQIFSDFYVSCIFSKILISVTSTLEGPSLEKRASKLTTKCLYEIDSKTSNIKLFMPVINLIFY